MHCSEHDPQRPPGATHRVIYSLYVDLEPEPCDKTGGKALVTPLDRRGMPLGGAGTGNGRPRPPKRRTIDLRIGDYLLCAGRWARITGIRAHSSSWLTDEAAIAYRGGGYVYRLA